MLTLKRAVIHRPGEWDKDDYDVYEGEQHLGRIFLSPQASRDEPWFWTITARFPQSAHDHGYAASREKAMLAFKAVWERKP